MKILALIAARAGSKRLPGKNKRLLIGSPLVLWSVRSVRGISEVCDTLVSTDDNQIAEMCSSEGALVPWLRPTELAGDDVPMFPVALHALDWYEQVNGRVDGLMLLQPTSPFRSAQTVKRGIELFGSTGGRPVVAVSPARSHPMRCFDVRDDRMTPFINDKPVDLRTQELPPAYEVNGSLYLITPKDLKKHESFYAENMFPLIVESFEESIDIDTELDWRLAEAFYRN
jgi:CMP-N,N'-diacetyllegionaminic acid synthase